MTAPAAWVIMICRPRLKNQPEKLAACGPVREFNSGLFRCGAGRRPPLCLRRAEDRGPDSSGFSSALYGGSLWAFGSAGGRLKTGSWTAAEPENSYMSKTALLCGGGLEPSLPRRREREGKKQRERGFPLSPSIKRFLAAAAPDRRAGSGL